MNNEKFTNEYIDKVKGLKLSESARARIEGSLREYATFHPISTPERISSPDRSILRVPFGISSFTKLNTRPMTGLFVALALVLTGGVSYAAEGSVPGDFLYPVKVGVNEEVKGAFALSAESEAELSAELAAERLEEAEKLSAEGRLSAEVAADLSTRFSEHYEDAVRNASAVQSSGKAEAAAAVRSSLVGTVDAHALILQNLDTVIVDSDASVILDSVFEINSDLETDLINYPGPDTNEVPDTDNYPEVDDAEPMPRGGYNVGGTIEADVDVQPGAPGVSGSGSAGVNISY